MYQKDRTPQWWPVAGQICDCECEARERGGGGRRRWWKGGGRTRTVAVGDCGYWRAAASYIVLFPQLGLLWGGPCDVDTGLKAFRPMKFFFFLSEHFTAHEV